MKKIIILLSILVAISLPEVLYGTHDQPDEAETVAVEHATILSHIR